MIIKRDSAAAGGQRVVTMSPASTLVFVLAAVYAADALPGGAPQSACDNLTPSHSGIAAQTSAVPYSIDLLPFADGSGGYQYTPGTTYTGKN